MAGLGNLCVTFKPNSQNIIFEYGKAPAVRDAVKFAARAPPLTAEAFQDIVEATCSAEVPHDMIAAADTKSTIKQLLKVELRKHESKGITTTAVQSSQGMQAAPSPPPVDASSGEIKLAGFAFAFDVYTASIKLRHPTFASKAASCALARDGGRGGGSGIKPHILHGMRRGLELEAASCSIVGRGGEPDISKVQELMSRVIAGY